MMWNLLDGKNEKYIEHVQWQQRIYMLYTCLKILTEIISKILFILMRMNAQHH